MLLLLLRLVGGCYCALLRGPAAACVISCASADACASRCILEQPGCMLANLRANGLALAVLNGCRWCMACCCVCSRMLQHAQDWAEHKLSGTAPVAATPRPRCAHSALYAQQRQLKAQGSGVAAEIRSTCWHSVSVTRWQWIAKCLQAA